MTVTSAGPDYPLGTIGHRHMPIGPTSSRGHEGPTRPEQKIISLLLCFSPQKVRRLCPWKAGDEIRRRGVRKSTDTVGCSLAV
jgi:hypothetical protein